ncbi:MAG TPA: thiamine phosphate synthase [Kofleriaceae bacterium]|nr:thiamine phosphate synthase [Kofleriaceae bacterium]
MPSPVHPDHDGGSPGEAERSPPSRPPLLVRPERSLAGGQAESNGPRLCLVTDRHLMGLGDVVTAGDAARFAAAIARALDGVSAGAAWLQVREKDLGGRALAALVRVALDVARPRGVAVVVNERLDVALATGADGVHLPEDSLDVEVARAVAGSLVIGASRHAAGAAVDAARAGADLVQLGPIFATPSKAAYGAPLGLDALRATRAALTAAGLTSRLVAVGGIDSPARAREAIVAGADAVAVIRAIWSAAAPAATARALAASCAAPA